MFTCIYRYIERDVADRGEWFKIALQLEKCSAMQADIKGGELLLRTLLRTTATRRRRWRAREQTKKTGRGGVEQD